MRPMARRPQAWAPADALFELDEGYAQVLSLLDRRTAFRAILDRLPGEIGVDVAWIGELELDRRHRAGPRRADQDRRGRRARRAAGRRARRPGDADRAARVGGRLPQRGRPQPPVRHAGRARGGAGDDRGAARARRPPAGGALRRRPGRDPVRRPRRHRAGGRRGPGGERGRRGRAGPPQRGGGGARGAAPAGAPAPRHRRGHAVHDRRRRPEPRRRPRPAPRPAGPARDHRAPGRRGGRRVPRVARRAARAARGGRASASRCGPTAAASRSGPASPPGCWCSTTCRRSTRPAAARWPARSGRRCSTSRSTPRRRRCWSACSSAATGSRSPSTTTASGHRRRGTDRGGLGLAAATERLARVGGGLTMGRNDDGGVTVQAWVPR